MNTPGPSGIPLAEGEAALHLRFAITPIRPAHQHLPDGAEPVSGAQPTSAWHELTLAALLVCLMGEETDFAAASEAGAMPGACFVQTPQGEATSPLQPGPCLPSPELADPILADRSGLLTDDGWMTLLLSRSGVDTAWPLA